MSRDGIEVQIEAITREERDAERRVGSAAGSEEPGAPYVGCADEDESTGRIARARIDGQPQPEHLGGVAQSGSQFVQLQVREVQVAEGVLMEEFRVLACSREPPRHRGVSKAEDPPCSRKIQSFGQRREHHRDPAREGGFSRYKGVSRLEVNVVRHA